MLILLLSSAYANAQQDTLFVLFQNVESNNITKVGKHRNDPESKKYYPFDGGRHYRVSKTTGKFEDSYAFLFWSYTPKWMDFKFSYKVVDSCIFRKKDFKDATWFESKTGSEFVETFSGRDKIIYLIDETEITDKNNIYMVRVYFDYSSPE